MEIIDRFINRQKVKRKEIGILAASALLVASKYEDIYPPNLSEIMRFLNPSDKQTVTRDDIIDMESRILEVLGFAFTFPTSYRFMQRYARIVGLDDTGVSLATYLLQSALCDTEMKNVKP